MNEFKMLKEMLERAGATLEITVWGNMNESLIEDKTNKITYWFKENKLDYIDNDKDQKNQN